MTSFIQQYFKAKVQWNPSMKATQDGGLSREVEMDQILQL